MNDLLRPSHYARYHAVELAESQGWEHQRVAVVGPICETGEFLALDRDVEVVETGEQLVLRTTRPSSFSMSSTYNQRPRPAEVRVDGAEVSPVRRRETLEDLVAAELDL